MLISLSKKFVFVANLKTASTAIEKALRPLAELALVESRFGKHQTFREIETRFAWLLNLIDPKEMFVFGVIRDPVDYMVSLYNSHTDPKFKANPRLYAGDLDFEGFLREWTVRNADQIKQQYLHFLDRNGRIAANYIMSYSKLEEGLRFVSERIGVTALLSLGRENRSHGSFQVSSLSAGQRDWIEAHFAPDREVLKTYCDRLLTGRPLFAPNGQVDETDINAGSALPDQKIPTAGLPVATGLSESADQLAPQLVQALFRVLLHRDPDDVTLQERIGRIKKGLSVDSILVELLKSAEFAKKFAKFSHTYVSSHHIFVHSHRRSGTHFLLDTIRAWFDVPDRIHSILNPAVAPKYEPYSLSKDHEPFRAFKFTQDDIWRTPDHLRRARRRYNTGIHIYIVRNPLEVLRSAYIFDISGEEPNFKIDPKTSFFEYLTASSLHQGGAGLNRIDYWATHVNSWYYDESVLSVHYDDLKTALQHTLAVISEHLGLPVRESARDVISSGVATNLTKTFLAGGHSVSWDDSAVAAVRSSVERILGPKPWGNLEPYMDKWLSSPPPST